MTDTPVTSSRLAPERDRMRRFPVDIEHLGIRFSVPVVALVALVLTWVLAPRVLEALGLSDTAVGLAQLPLVIAAGVGGAYVTDRLLKGRWLSGREILADGQSLILREKNGTEKTIDFQERVNALAWRFTVKRRGRVPKGHLCVAFQLIQNEQEVTVYTFMSPNKVEALENVHHFTPLASRKTLGDDRLNMKVAGLQRRLLQAEDSRWEHGAELTTEAFTELWTLLQPCELVFLG